MSTWYGGTITNGGIGTITSSNYYSGSNADFYATAIAPSTDMYPYYKDRTNYNSYTNQKKYKYSIVYLIVIRQKIFKDIVGLGSKYQRR